MQSNLYVTNLGYSIDDEALREAMAAEAELRQPPTPPSRRRRVKATVS